MTLDFNTTWQGVEGTAKQMCSKYHIVGYTFEDKMQEAMMELWDTIQMFDESKGAKLNTFYYIRLRNRFTKVLQKVTRKKNYYNNPNYSVMDEEGILMLIASKYPNPEQNALRMENLKDMTMLVDSIHPHYREIIEYLLQGLERKEIAKKMDLEYATFSNRILDLRKLMKTDLTPKDVRHFNKVQDKKLKLGEGRKKKARKNG